MKKKYFLVIVAATAAIAVQAKDFDVRTYGAKGDGKTDDTSAIQNAIDDCSADGGGRVVVEKGTFLIRPIFLKDGVDLHIERNAKLLASADVQDYKSRDNLKHVIGQNMCRGRDSALITADEAHGVSITGNGMIDGNADAFVRLLPEEKNALADGNCRRLALSSLQAVAMLRSPISQLPISRPAGRT